MEGRRLLEGVLAVYRLGHVVAPSREERHESAAGGFVVVSNENALSHGFDLALCDVFVRSL